MPEPAGVVVGRQAIPGEQSGNDLVASGRKVGGPVGPPQEGEVEIGYGIVPSLQRRGYATEAVQAMVADIFQLDSVLTVTANVDLDNPASIRVLEKSGMALCTQNQEQATYHIRRPPPGRGGLRTAEA